METRRGRGAHHSLIRTTFDRLDTRHDFTDLDLHRITHRTNVTPASFCQRFHSMSRLNLAVISRDNLVLHRLVHRTHRHVTGNKDIVHASISAFVRFVNGGPGTFQLLLQRHSNASTTFHTTITHRVRRFVTRLTSCLRLRGRVPHTFARTRTRTVIAVIFDTNTRTLSINIRRHQRLRRQLMLRLQVVSGKTCC